MTNWAGICLGRLDLDHFRYGKVERVKKIKDYAFVHFEERDQALAGEIIYKTFPKLIHSDWL